MSEPGRSDAGRSRNGQATTRRGNPNYAPSDADKAQVKLFKALNCSDEAIARRLGVSLSVLRKAFAFELEHGAEQLMMSLGQAIFLDALQGGDLVARRRFAERFGILTPPPAAAAAARPNGLPAPGPDGKIHVTMQLGDAKTCQRMARQREWGEAKAAGRDPGPEPVFTEEDYAD